MFINAETSSAEQLLPSSRWYAIYTKHQHEKKSAELLARKRIEVYLPLYDCVRQWQDRRKKLEVPLFPGYVFVRSTLENRIDILRTPGVFFIVESAGRACSVPDRDVESMRTMSHSRAAIQPHPFLQGGDYVRIHRGPFTGVQGILTRVKGQHRIVLCVELLRKAVSVEIMASDAEKIEKPIAAGRG
jgi:transcription antitermination factor NusG